MGGFLITLIFWSHTKTVHKLILFYSPRTFFHFHNSDQKIYFLMGYLQIINEYKIVPYFFIFLKFVFLSIYLCTYVCIRPNPYLSLDQYTIILGLQSFRRGEREK